MVLAQGECLAYNIAITPHHFIPIPLEDAGVLAALTHPNHLLLVGSWGFTRLPPTHIFNGNGYISISEAEMVKHCTLPFREEFQTND